MAVLYPGTSVSGYNANPPPDDGTTVTTNLITWANTKVKIGDPLNTFAGSVDSNITAAFGKTLDGAATIATGISYQVLSADQGKLIKATASGITITTPDATVVGFPFSFAVNNLLSNAGTITLKGSGSQNVDGSNTQTIQAGGGCIVKTDGSNWFTFGISAPPTAATVFYNPDIQVFTSGSAATYTTATNGGNLPKYLLVRMVAGGGGGGDSATNSGGNGGDSSFGTWTAIHGTGGTGGASTHVGGTGGAGGTNGTGTPIRRIAGTNGGAGSGAGSGFAGGFGGASAIGGAAVNTANSTSAGVSAAANSGSGGSGGNNQGGAGTGAGGGAGEYVEFVVTSPAASYTYTVGTSGSAGSGGASAGGAGAAGHIEVIGYWQ